MLTIHQEEKLGELLYLILNQGKKRVVLQGSAGVGKTYLVQELLRRLRNQGARGLFYVTAPTNKALAVLKKKVMEETFIVFKTVHSALSLTRQINFETGEETFVPGRTNILPFEGAGLCIVDEASMLSKELLKYLDEHPGMPTIFIGDAKQLPPVKESISPIFAKDYPIVELTEIIRQGEGNPIIDLSRNLSWVKGNNECIVASETEENKYIGFTYSSDKQKVIDALAAVNGTDDIKYLAWHNADVDKMNRLVRTKIYGEPAKIELGEVLVLSKPYLDRYTNEEIEVKKLEIKEERMIYPTAATQFRKGLISSGPGTYEQVNLKVYVVNGYIRVIHEDSETEYRKLSSELKSDCKSKRKSWPAYYWFIEQLAHVTYNHAITVHKSQGSTYKKAIINVKDINQNFKSDERTKLFYTAVTRASDLVILYNN